MVTLFLSVVIGKFTMPSSFSLNSCIVSSLIFTKESNIDGKLCLNSVTNNIVTVNIFLVQSMEVSGYR